MSDPDCGENGRAPWWEVIVTSSLLLVLGHTQPVFLGFDTDLAPWWTPLYITSGWSLLVWRLTLRRWLLVMFGATLFAAELSRCMIQVSDRYWSGAALNALVAMYAWRFVACQSRWSRTG